MTLRRVAPRREDRDPVSRAMVEEYGRVLAGESARWVHELTENADARLERGGMHAVVWLPDGHEAAGLAMWDFLPGVGRRVWIYLAPAQRTAEALGRFLDELDARGAQEGAVAGVVDFLPGLDLAEQEAALGARSFSHTERIILRYPADASLPDESLFGRPDLRPIEASDLEGLVALMRSAYDPLVGPPAPWLAYRDPGQDAREAIEEILSGRRGEWLPWASFGLDLHGALAGAILVSRLDVPVLSEVMVAPEVRGIRLGYYLVLESVRVLREHGSGEPYACASGQDLRALRLYRRAGFEVLDERAVGLWVHRPSIGAASPQPAGASLPPTRR